MNKDFFKEPLKASGWDMLLLACEQLRCVLPLHRFCMQQGR